MNWFKGSFAVGAIAASLMFSACQQPVNVTKSSSSGSLALSTDDAYLYAVDNDNGTLTVLDTKTEAKVATVKVGLNPQRVAVGPDDTIYVTNKGSNTVSVIRKGDWKEAATIPVGTEPTSLAVSPDNKRLYVVNSTGVNNAEFGTLTAIDTATLQPAFDLSIGQEPRGLALLGNDKAVVTLYKEGELVEVDLKNAQLAKNNGTTVYAAANASGSQQVYSTFKPRGANDVVATPDGTRVFAPVIWAREDAIRTTPNSFGGYYAQGGPCNVGGVATAGLVVADQGSNGGSLQPQVDDLTACQSSGVNSEEKDYPSTLLAGASSGFNTAGQATTFQIQGTVAAAIDPTGSWVYLVNKESSSVAVVPAFRRSGEDINFKSSGTSVRQSVALNEATGAKKEIGGSSGPDGIALTRDGNKAFVYNQFDHRVDVLEGKDTDSGKTIVKTRGIVIAGDTLTPEAVAGRKLFFNAIDQRISAQNVSVSCATCHLEAGDDGHIWSFPDGPRQTPALAGRKMKETGPYHWSGEFSDTNKFMRHTIIERMGGSGLDTEKDMQNIIEFVDALPAPQNANLKQVRTDAQLRGAQVFQKANCASCHSGALLTDKKSHDVGTLVSAKDGKIADNGVVLKLNPDGTRQGLDAPSLLGLARSAPYLHDGSAKTLEDRVKDANDKHGNLTNLTSDERSDLVQYLKTL